MAETWEHCVRWVPLHRSGADAVCKILDEVGADGWMLVSVVPCAVPADHGTAFFRRSLASVHEADEKAGVRVEGDRGSYALDAIRRAFAQPEARVLENVMPVQEAGGAAQGLRTWRLQRPAGPFRMEEVGAVMAPDLAGAVRHAVVMTGRSFARMVEEGWRLKDAGGEDLTDEALRLAMGAPGASGTVVFDGGVAVRTWTFELGGSRAVPRSVTVYAPDRESALRHFARLRGASWPALVVHGWRMRDERGQDVTDPWAKGPAAAENDPQYGWAGLARHNSGLYGGQGDVLLGAAGRDMHAVAPGSPVSVTWPREAGAGFRFPPLGKAAEPPLEHSFLFRPPGGGTGIIVMAETEQAAREAFAAQRHRRWEDLQAEGWAIEGHAAAAGR